jgi:hypothetical protein
LSFCAGSGLPHWFIGTYVQRIKGWLEMAMFWVSLHSFNSSLFLLWPLICPRHSTVSVDDARLIVVGLSTISTVLVISILLILTLQDI